MGRVGKCACGEGGVDNSILLENGLLADGFACAPRNAGIGRDGGFACCERGQKNKNQDFRVASLLFHDKCIN